ncbi:hypothetical protein GCM10009857_30240 [Agromyces soli]
MALAFSVPFGILMVGRGARWPGAAIAAVAAQLALHITFSLSAGSSPSGIVAGADPHALHGAAGAVSRDAWLAVAGTGQLGHGDHFGAAMPLAHLAAAVLAVASIALADRAVRALVRAARGILVAVALLVVPVVGASRAVLRRPEPPRRPAGLQRLAAVVVRRGPPCGVGAV